MENLDKQIIEKVAKELHIPLQSEPSRYQSGIISRVYDLGDFVLKIEGEREDVKGILKHQIEIIPKLLSAGAKVPRIVTAGEVKGKPYFVMAKLQGRNLAKDWLSLSDLEKENLISQLAEQLKIFHSLKFDAYALSVFEAIPTANLMDAIFKRNDFGRVKAEELKPEYYADLELLKQYSDENLHILDEENTAVFVHNDIHLENIFADNGALTGIIDFDWSSQAPKDYELWKICRVFYEPMVVVEDQFVPLYKGYRMEKELKYLQKYYPALFEHKDLLTRVRLFLISDITWSMMRYQKGIMSENGMIRLHQMIKDFYTEGDWLDKMLSIKS